MAKIKAVTIQKREDLSHVSMLKINNELDQVSNPGACLKLRKFHDTWKEKNNFRKPDYVSISQARPQLPLTMTGIVVPADSYVLVVSDHPQAADLVQTISQQTKNVAVKQYTGIVQIDDFN